MAHNADLFYVCPIGKRLSETHALQQRWMLLLKKHFSNMCESRLHLLSKPENKRKTKKKDFA